MEPEEDTKEERLVNATEGMEKKLKKIEHELKARRSSFRSLLLGVPLLIIAGLEFLSFQYYPRSQRALYNKQLKPATYVYLVEYNLHKLGDNKVAEAVGVYQRAKIDLFRSILE